MEDARVGSVLRAVRVRQRLTQAEVASLAGVARATVSRLERGDLENATLRTIRQVGRALAVALPLDPRWRGSDLASLMDEKHARLVELVARKLAGPEWTVRPEHTFSVWGERGSIDILAWHPRLRAVLVIEVKTRIVDVQDLFSTMDRKRRLAMGLARELGWQPVSVGSLLVLPEATLLRNAVARHEALFGSALPARGMQVRGWLREPRGDLRGIWFLLDSHRESTKSRSHGVMRVRKRRPPAARPISRSAPPAAIPPASPDCPTPTGS